jgi:glycosyltransferase involved in cell wall biosynthesis
MPTITIGHLLPPNFLLAPTAEQPRFTFGYLGSGNPWNVRSIRTLDQELVNSRDIDWLLAGSILKQPLHLKSLPFPLGHVNKLEEFYSAVRCVINPMSGGTGLKIKTVEALSYGRPIIGTVDAFVGLPTRHAAHRLEGIVECAAMMRAYVSNSSLREEIALASRVLYFAYALEIGRGIDRLSETVERGIKASGISAEQG